MTLDAPGLGYLLKQRLDRLAMSLHRQPKEVSQLQQLLVLADLARTLPFEVDLFQAQNVCYEILNTEAVEFRGRSAQGEEGADLAGPVCRPDRPPPSTNGKPDRDQPRDCPDGFQLPTSARRKLVRRQAELIATDWVKFFRNIFLNKD